MTHEYPNNYMLQRIAGGSFDFMIAAAITCWLYENITYYMIPTLLITTIGGIVTIFFILWMTRRIFKEDIFENTLFLRNIYRYHFYHELY